MYLVLHFSGVGVADGISADLLNSVVIFATAKRHRVAPVIHCHLVPSDSFQID